MESENKYINKEHEGIVEQYVLYLKKLVYFATEDAGNMKFQEYTEILESVFMYSNNFYDTMTKKKAYGRRIYVFNTKHGFLP